MKPTVTVVVPTLAADTVLLDCLHSLERQTRRDFEVMVVDNSGKQLARRMGAAAAGAALIENHSNAGFGSAVNQGFRRSEAPFLAVLNDDAVAQPDWLGNLVGAMEASSAAGMCASQIRLAGGANGLDSAGLRISGDGSSKQDGRGAPPEAFAEPKAVLCPSGCAALYRRAMLEQIGMFDESFFLYCEDTDLGLRGRWAGWECLYVPDAVVEHRYSHSAGEASPLKAYYVERNRLYLLMKNFPLPLILLAPAYSLARYAWHLRFLLAGRGAAGKFHAGGEGGWKLAWFVLKAHGAALVALPRLLAQRRAIRRSAKLTPVEFRRLLRRFAISPRQVAAQ